VALVVSRSQSEKSGMPGQARHDGMGMETSDQLRTFPTPLPFREGLGVGAPRSGGLRSIGQKLATLATHPNPSLEGRGYVLFQPNSVIPAQRAGWRPGMLSIVTQPCT
jgi:hypothetical protein